MREILSHLILPLPLFWTGLLLVVIFHLFKKKNIARIMLWVSFVWLLLITTPFLPDLLVSNLENQYSTISETKLDSLNGHVNVLVLGGGITNDLRLPPNNQLSEIALCRLSEGIRIVRIIPDSKLITSGWGGREQITSAEVMAKAALLLGVDSSLILSQQKPENTLQEATEYKSMHGDSTQLIVVTSAIHMPRAMYLFQKAGLNPIAAPTNHLVKTSLQHDPWYWNPSSYNIRKMEAAIHEYIGLFWSKLGGS